MYIIWQPVRDWEIRWLINGPILKFNTPHNMSLKFVEAIKMIKHFQKPPFLELSLCLENYWIFANTIRDQKIKAILY